MERVIFREALLQKELLRKGLLQNRLAKTLLIVSAVGLLIGLMGITAGCQQREIIRLQADEDSEGSDSEGFDSEESDSEESDSEIVCSEIASSEIADCIEDGSKESGSICVFVCGQVEEPGVYYLESDSRICDALSLAGGLTESANINAVNQAEVLIDGSMIYIPSLDEDVKQVMTGQSRNNSSNGYSDNEGLASSVNSSYEGRLNLNTATQEELMSLPGIGEAKANSIIEYRRMHGSFSSVEELKNVTGIKEGIVNQIREYIIVE